jgi:23S rRNA pseudouridine2605 synthase
MEERIQKILSACGITSRRKAEEMILQGCVTVNGKIAALGMKADIEKDHIKVNGKLIMLREPKICIVLNKPVRCITSLHDPEGRTTIKDFLKSLKSRVYPVGRLDYDAEGLVLLTNDGQLAQAIMHPKKKIPKTYHVKIKGVLEDGKVHRLEKGVRLQDGVTAPAKIKKIRKEKMNSWIEVTIHEGRKHQVKRMLEKVGHSVLKLKRTKIDGLSLGNVPVGRYRYLTPEEIKVLRMSILK